MKDRFDLENEISALYAFTDQLSNVSEGLMEAKLTTDEAVNAIEGINVLLKLQTEKLFNTMTQCLKLDNYRYQYNPAGNVNHPDYYEIDGGY